MQRNANQKVTIIAEAGVNHNGSLDLAFKLVDAAAEAGVDYVKFQTFKTELCISKFAPLAEYQKKNQSQADNQFELVKKLELSDADHFKLVERCKQRGIKFLSTGFDIPSLRFLKSIGMDFFKIPSGEITNLPYLREMASYNTPIVMSTGMADMAEIEEVLKIFPNHDITVLHCNTEYPTPFSDVNLKAMTSIANRFKTKVGYSDHTLGIEVPIAAVALGATVIEKHFTLDRDMIGPDHKASLTVPELKEMVRTIRNIEVCLGDGVKVPSPSEIKNKAIARKSIVAAKDIKKGEVFTSENLTTKRPGIGVSPMNWDSVMGLVSDRDYQEDELIVL